MNKGELKRLVLKSFLEQQLAMLTALGPVAYMITLLLGLPPDLALHVSLINFGTLTPVFGATVPLVVIYVVMKGALESRPNDAPGERLIRLLKAPRKIEMGCLLGYAVSCVLWAGWPTLAYGLNPWVVPQVVLAFLLLATVATIRQTMGLERLLRPYTLKEFHKRPDLRLNASGFFWPKQRWYLPYCFALFVFATLAVTGMIISKKSQSGFGELFKELAVVAPTHVELVRTRVAEILGDMVMPVLSIGGFLIFLAAWCAWGLARHQSQGTDAVRRSIESLASGKPALPDWVSTDEVGDLSSATATAFGQLRSFSASLGESAQMLGQSAEQLGVSHKQQTESLSIQASSLQETQVTAQEIKQTSMMASEKAESVLRQAEKAEQISRAGEGAIELSLRGLQDIQRQVLQMAESIRSLEVRTKQIANITTTVKSLADQSNMLALNAAIEAVRSGEHGKGFAVVAREIRSLADQSIKATYSVRDVLEELSNAIRDTATMSEVGSEKVQSSLGEVQKFGDNIRQLSTIVRDNASAVRQISSAVTQQNTGISQIFQAVNDLTKIMDQTMASLRTSDEAAFQMRKVAGKVNDFVDQYAWQDQHAQGQEKPGAAPKGGVTSLPLVGDAGVSGSASTSAGRKAAS